MTVVIRFRYDYDTPKNPYGYDATTSQYYNKTEKPETLDV